MKVMIVAGSRSREGQTARAVNAFASGCTEAGAETKTVFLPELDIKVCNQCGADNWGTCKTKGVCCINDDLASVVTSIREADAVLFATPVFYDDVAECIQAFTRRLRRMTSNENGRAGITDKPAVVLAMAGARGKGSSACCANLESMLKGTGFDVVDLLPIRKQNLNDKLETLGSAGERLVKSI